jgi:hypothetical protein
MHPRFAAGDASNPWAFPVCIFGSTCLLGYWVEFRGHLASHLVSPVINYGALIGSNTKIDFHIHFLFLLGEEIVLKIN